MTWYRAFYGTWQNGDSVRQIPGTFNRKAIFEEAQKTANETKRKVTISAEHGMHMEFYTVNPQ